LLVAAAAARRSAHKKGKSEREGEKEAKVTLATMFIVSHLK
jgi:hypothetical protein